MAAFKIGKVLMKSLFGGPSTLMYPEKPAKITENTRGHMTINIEDCIFCTLCAKKCPTNAITVDRKARTWSIERMRCIQCNACASNCAKGALHMANTYTTPSTEKIVDTFQGPPAPEKKPMDDAAKEAAIKAALAKKAAKEAAARAEAAAAETPAAEEASEEKA